MSITRLMDSVRGLITSGICPTTKEQGIAWQELVAAHDELVDEAHVSIGWNEDLAGLGFTVNGMASFDWPMALRVAGDVLRELGAPVPEAERPARHPLAQIRGLPIAEIKVGMRLQGTLAGNSRIVTVTELTEKGFKYTCDPYYVRAGGVSGTVSEGEAYARDGYSFYDLAKEDGDAV